MRAIAVLGALLSCGMLVTGCGNGLPAASTVSSSAASNARVTQATCNPFGGDKLTFCEQALANQCAAYAAVHTAVFTSPPASDCFKGAYARHNRQPNPCGSNAACNSGYRGNANPVTATNAAPASSAPQPTINKAAPNPHGKPAFSGSGKTEHGDTVRLEGRFGPILPPSESDVDHEALQTCPEADGRELVRRLDLTVFITSSLSADVRMIAPTVSANYEEGAENIRNLNFVVAAPQGTSCRKGLGEEQGYVADFGTLQPHEHRTLSVWVVLIDAVTPTDPHPSLKHLKAQEWLMTNPTVLVDGATAISGGTIYATE